MPTDRFDNLDRFTRATFEAAEFTDASTNYPEEGSVLAGAEWDADAALDLRADCRSFWRRFGCFVLNTDKTPEQAGHDFWLTRNGHGAGFWDGDWSHTAYEEILTRGANSYGEFAIYQGDDGKVYV